MLELAIMLIVVFQVNKITTERGLPKVWLAAALAIPVVGFIVATVAGIGLAMVGMDSGTLTLAMIPFALVAEGLTAWGILALVKSRPAGVVSPYAQPGAPIAPPQYPAPAPMAVAPATGPQTRMAGFCSECGANVWLKPDGSCENGHSAASVSNPYSVTGA